MKYFVDGLTKRQIEVFEQIAIGQHKGHHLTVLKELLSKYLIEFATEEYSGDIIYYVPTPVHMKWCEWCSKQEFDEGVTIQPYYMDFIIESNKIEGIHREPTKAEIDEFFRFLHLDKVEIKDLKKFVSIYAPGNILRDKSNLNVSIGGYYAPFGGKKIKTELDFILREFNVHGKNDPWQTHVNYELLHPFTDGNGRSGRMLWAWQMTKKNNGEFPRLGFLHSFYYQTLKEQKKVVRYAEEN